MLADRKKTDGFHSCHKSSTRNKILSASDLTQTAKSPLPTWATCILQLELFEKTYVIVTFENYHNQAVVILLFR